MIRSATACNKSPQAATPPPICASRAANRLEFLNGQQVYTFDDNGNLLQSDTLTNTCASRAANRLIETIRQTDQTTNRLTPIYNGVNDRVGQTVGLSTTNYVLSDGLDRSQGVGSDQSSIFRVGIVSKSRRLRVTRVAWYVRVIGRNA